MTAGKKKGGGPARPPLRLLLSGIIVLVLLAIQFVPVSRTNPPAGDGPLVDAEVGGLLRNACYGCHSYETRWPWYSRIAPVSWLIAGHVNEGRAHLNFSRWPALDFDLEDELLRQIAAEVKSGRMPPASYKLLHPEARLDASQQDLLVRWAGGDLSR